MHLQELLNRHIFESYEVITKTDLDTDIRKVFILQTADYRRYLSPKSIVLTTFDTIHQHITEIDEMLLFMAEKKTAGILMVDTSGNSQVPKNLAISANRYHIPVILLHNEANLSNAVTTIYNELQADDYRKHNFHLSFTEAMEEIQKNPSPEVLTAIVRRIPGYDIGFYEYSSGEFFYTAMEIRRELADTELLPGELTLRGSSFWYMDDISFNDRMICRMVLRSRDENRNTIMTYIEVIKILIQQVHQRKTDLAMHLDQYLMNFVVNFTSSYSTNQDIIEEGKIYKWQIEFPMLMILVTSRSTTKDLPNNGIIVNQLKTDIIREYGIEFNEVKYISFQNKITFLLNSKYNEHISTRKLRNIMESDTVYDDYLFAVAKPIDDAAQLPIVYRQITEASNYIYVNNPSAHYIPPDFIDFYRIIKSMNKNDLTSLMNDLLAPLVEFERSHNVPLIKTLLVYIQSHFNIKQASKDLYIHYNTLKYRLGVIKNLGYDISDTTYTFLPLYMSLYLYDIGLVQI
ncbi:MAG: PucR family transcriptional regulator ligand-binding domain-containing protein [Solobacterium sp.]|nr:PucR family transcriptional regulator ligand-binding domain-containing protein [Solobacterium sp.]